VAAGAGFSSIIAEHVANGSDRFVLMRSNDEFREKHLFFMLEITWANI
jgi:hypothetical protein